MSDDAKEVSYFCRSRGKRVVGDQIKEAGSYDTDESRPMLAELRKCKSKQTQDIGS